ncbi:MAG: Bcr/CflA family drug resistance efflux transporter [Rhizobiales bacterium]|nr:Bcr/CflA family drug resistance efflux transporter [Hyphomicrobiales bacterium]MBA68680.1 Bcr/CflA family drug resistance efflux transporter [Hyphomicrobiales bacterium]|tara:strand:- start:1594 stop:2838 length:1245 start_codon:yes stop_codon:yes gene_type:complete
MRKSVFLDRATPPSLATLVLVTGMGALNLNIFLPSLPAIAAYYDADYALVQLSVSGYLAVTAALQLFIGPLSDRYGRRPVMLASLAIFQVATVLVILAPTITLFLAARMLQAAVVASLVLPRAMIRDVVGQEEAASRIGYVTMFMSVVPMVSPALGGFLAGLFGWHATFAAAFLFGLVVFLLFFFDAGETHHNRSTSILRQFGAYPELFRSRRFWGYALTASFSAGAFYAFLGGAPYVANTVLGLDAESIGAYFAIIAVGYMLGNFLSGRYAKLLGITRMMIWGSLIAAIGALIPLFLFLAGYVDPLAFFGPTFLVGMGNGMTLPSANAGMVSVRPHLAGSASGLGGSLMIGGGAVLSSAVGAALTPETGIYPLIAAMFLTMVGAMIASAYVRHVDKLAAREAGARLAPESLSR